jgi:DNA repair exonuclease SbcCD ATPase subunit
MQNTELEMVNLEARVKSLGAEISELEGQRTILAKQLTTSEAAIIQFAETIKLDEKSIEVLALVQRATRDKIKESFEQMVTFALQSIYQQDYKFRLDFDTRGNLGEMNFQIKPPDCEDYLDLKDCTAGGSYDIVALALRFILIQVLRPKIEGFIMLDEPTKQLSKEYRENELNFYKYIADKLGRQLIVITHSEVVVNQAEDKIEVGK